MEGVFLGAHGVGEFKVCVTVAGISLLAFFSNWLSCHISVSERLCLNEGIPLRRIPFAIIQ
jgi:hypothetical protein